MKYSVALTLILISCSNFAMKIDLSEIVRNKKIQEFHKLEDSGASVNKRYNFVVENDIYSKPAPKINDITKAILKKGGDLVGEHIGDTFCVKIYGEEQLKWNKKFEKDHPIKTFIYKTAINCLVGCVFAYFTGDYLKA